MNSTEAFLFEILDKTPPREGEKLHVTKEVYHRLLKRHADFSNKFYLSSPRDPAGRTLFFAGVKVVVDEEVIYAEVK